MGLFRTADKARRRLRKLRQRKKVKIVGIAQLKDGRPEQVWARWSIAAEKAQHEAEITEFLVRLDGARVVRGCEVDDFAPDAMVWLGAELFYVEHDRDTMGYAQVVERMRQYEGCQGIVLWICPRQSRLEGMMRRAAKLPEAIRSLFLFGLFDEAVADPHGEIWTDCEGVRVPI
jgi:hypothetical protein